jgi:hypothetical protein
MSDWSRDFHSRVGRLGTGSHKVGDLTIEVTETEVALPTAFCNAEWGYDVDVVATSDLPFGHEPVKHRSEMMGNEDVLAVIQWETTS